MSDIGAEIHAAKWCESWQLWSENWTPLTCKSIMGDGNCLFRSLSFIITGSEDQHLLLQGAIVRHMREVIGELLWENHIYPDPEYRDGLEQYIPSPEWNSLEHGGHK